MAEPSPTRTPQAPDELLSHEERETLSTRRIQLRLVAFTLAQIGGLSALVFVLVSQIFSTLTPPLQRDLENKALSGTSLLSRELDLGLLTEDPELIARASKDYSTEPNKPQKAARK